MRTGVENVCNNMSQRLQLVRACAHVCWEAGIDNTRAQAARLAHLTEELFEEGGGGGMSIFIETPRPRPPRSDRRNPG